MATVIGVTAERANAIEDKVITMAEKQGTSLIFRTQGGTVLSIDNAFPAPFEFYPVGTIYSSVNSANPSTYMGGGTWQRWGKGRVPVGVDETQAEFDTVEATNSLSTKTFTLSIANLPAHNHDGLTGDQDRNHTHTGTTDFGGEHQHTYNLRAGFEARGTGNNTAATYSLTSDYTSAGGLHQHTFTTSQANQGHYHSIPTQGSGAPVNNLQPYITVYMWKRTA